MATIMIVDDEDDVRKTIKGVLEKDGYKIIEAISGDDALEKLKTEKPDLILMDIMMPGTPTKDVVKQIKGIKLIFLSVVRTSEAEKEDLLKTENMVDFIQKPFDINDLRNRIKKFVGSNEVKTPKTNEVAKPKVSEVTKPQVAKPSVEEVKKPQTNSPTSEIKKPQTQ